VNVDLLDTRGRVIRLAIAVAVGVVLAIFAFREIETIAASPNPDPMSKLSGLLLGGGLFAASTAIVHAILTRVARRRRAGA